MAGEASQVHKGRLLRPGFQLSSSLMEPITEGSAVSET